MQALVKHFAAQSAPQRIEAVVLHLSIAALDLDQVIRLAERHRLHSAALYVLTRINDYRRPLVDLLGAVVAAHAAGDAAGAREVGLKVLVWIRAAFKGIAYPPNTGLIAGCVVLRFGGGREGRARVLLLSGSLLHCWRPSRQTHPSHPPPHPLL